MKTVKKNVKKAEEITKTITEVAKITKKEQEMESTIKPKMMLWTKETGPKKRVIAIPVDCNENGSAKEGTKYVNLYLSQWVNDKRASRATRIGLGTTEKSMYFAGQNERINRVWGTIPQTIEEAKKQSQDNFLNLWNQAEGSTPQTFAVEDKNGTINLVVYSRFDAEEDMQYIVIQLGDTGKAIEISPVKGTIRQTEVSEPFVNVPEAKAEITVL